MDSSKFSNNFNIRKLNNKDITSVYDLCKENKSYYQHCPPFVTEKSIGEDMKALPPEKSIEDKYYLGYFEKGKLIAVLDLILKYPDEKTAFVGFFMTNHSIQNTGVGSMIIEQLCDYLSVVGFDYVRLGWVKWNFQAEHFWKKNKFVETGATWDTNGYTIIVAQRIL